MKMLGISGSLRKQSHNGRLLQQLKKHAEQGVELEIFDAVASIPVFNEDLEGDATPAPVLALWRAVAASDGVLFATPEYNQSLPGSTKNLVDWISRVPQQARLTHKPVAVVGATVGMWGTRIAQQQLRTVLLTLGARVMPAPALFVAKAGEQEVEPAALSAFMAAFANWTRSGGSTTGP